ncbi:MAG: hypothetical protein AB7I33_08775 [Gemmatimonadales bacterium]
MTGRYEYIADGPQIKIDGRYLLDWRSVHRAGGSCGPLYNPGLLWALVARANQAAATPRYEFVYEEKRVSLRIKDRGAPILDMSSVRRPDGDATPRCDPERLRELVEMANRAEELIP